MAETASDVLISVLQDWGVDTVFGLPGDGVDGVIEALRKKKDRVRFIHVRHEECAAFAACSYAKHTGRLGVCLATSGPGAIHLLNGLYDAKMDQQPVLAITGMQFHDVTNTFTQQDVEVDKLFMDVAQYNVRIMGPAHVEPATELACRSALTNRSVSSITIPIDFQSMSMSKSDRSPRNVQGHSRAADISAHQKRPPARESVERAAEVLNAGKKIVILAGRGALNCVDELEQLAEKLGAPIIKPLLLAKEISKRLRGDAIVNCDSGTITTWWARHIIAQRGQMHTVSGTLATMACGIPYAIGAQAAYPERQVIAFIGDGSASMLMGDFATADRKSVV